MFAQIYQMIVSLIIGVISARYLGPNNYGIINYAASFVSFFSIVCALGLEGIVVKAIIDNRNDEGVILGSSIIMRFVAGILSIGAVCIIVEFLNPGDHTLGVVAFMQSLALMFNSAHIIDAWYQSIMRSKVTTIIKCISYTEMSIYRVWLLVTGKSVEWFAFATSLDALIIAVLFIFSYRKDGIHRLSFNFRISQNLLGASYHLIISNVMAALYNQMDRIMIGKIIDQTHVGYYAAASSICHMWMFIPTALANSARPLIMELKRTDENLYMRRLQQLTGVIFWLGFFMAFCITLFSDFIINCLYGPEYNEARKALIFIIWSTVLSALSNARSIWMICENKQQYTKYLLMCGVVINLVLNGILIPTIGMNGAAIATIFTEGVCCFVAPYIIRPTREYARYQLAAINPIKLIRTFTGGSEE